MTENPSTAGAESIPPQQSLPHPPFPIVRVLYAIGFGVIASIVLYVLFAIAIVQLIVLAVNGKANDELKGFSLNLVQYLSEMMAFVTFARDEQPFPLGPFPRHS